MTILDYIAISVFITIFAGLAFSTLLQVDGVEIEPIVIEVREGTATVSKQILDSDGVAMSGVLPKDSMVKDLPLVDDFDLFEEFLVKEGIFEIFFARDMFYPWDNKPTAYCFVRSTFMWRNSEKKYNYWSNINNKWIKYLIKQAKVDNE